jgi:hypothetical protein
MRGLGSKSFGVGGPVVFLLLVSGASATTITFDGLTDFHTPFTTYTESGFAATVTNGIWGQGQAEGNPVPSIFTDCVRQALQMAVILGWFRRLG